MILALILILSMSCESNKATSSDAAVTNSETITPTNPSVTLTYTEQFMELVNNHRATLGLNALILNDELSQIVQDHSDAMASGSVAFGHSGFSTRCTDSRSALGGGNLCAENVAMGQKTPQAAFTSWMNSSGHKANIEQSRATHTGFGFKKSSSGTFYWTQIFIER